MSTGLKKSKTVSLSNKQYIEERERAVNEQVEKEQYMINNKQNAPIEKALSNKQDKRNSLLTPNIQVKIKTETDSSKLYQLILYRSRKKIKFN